MNEKQEGSVLITMTLIGIILLPFAIVKRSLKNWIIVYLVSCIGNAFADRFLVSNGYLKYRIRPLPERFEIHLPFDFVLFPLFLLYFNQWTLNSKLMGLFLKLMAFIIPQIVIETIAEKKTNLITWKKGWKWYHSFISMAMKFLLCRLIISSIRVLNNRVTSTT